MHDHSVRAMHCPHSASYSEIRASLERATGALESSWNTLEHAHTILIKANVIWHPDRIRYFEGRRRELVDDDVLRAVLELLRERTNADISLIDTTLIAAPSERPGPELNVLPLLDEFGVSFIDANEPPFELVDVPLVEGNGNGGAMFRRYQLHQSIANADAFVSVAKLKNHAFMGVTGCTKNLFGLPPIPPHGRSRTYYHHLIRLPYVLTDLALITKPCLNIIDGLVGQSGREWEGEGRIADVLIAGDNAIATDAVATHLMGHDPTSDWPTPPFRRDRNHLLVAATHGYGTVSLDSIDLESDVSAPLAQFDSEEVDSPNTVKRWRRTTCEQALYYREHARELIDRYCNEYIFLQDDRVVWHGEDPSTLGSRRDLSGANKDSALFLKKADPEEIEGEHFSVYEHALQSMPVLTV